MLALLNGNVILFLSNLMAGSVFGEYWRVHVILFVLDSVISPEFTHKWNYMLAILNGNVILFFLLDSGMNYSRQESHNRAIVPYPFRMIGEGLCQYHRQ